MDSNSVPPSGQGDKGPAPPDPNQKQKPSGSFQYTGVHKFLGMTFQPDDWNKLMNILLKNLNDYINKTYQKMTDKLKKDWARGTGEDVDD